MSRKFCTQCGQKLSAADKFCPNCGTKVLPSQDRGTAVVQKCDAQPAVPEVPVPDTVIAQEERPTQAPETTGDKDLPKGFAAFLEMWAFIVSLVMTDSKEGKRECRREAKLRMYRAPILTIACPVTAIALFVLSIILDVKTKVPFFMFTTIAFAMISFFVVFGFLIIYFTKLTDEDKARLTTERVWAGDAKNQKTNTKYVGWLVRALLFLLVIGLIGYAVFSYKGDLSRISRSIASSTSGSPSQVSFFESKARTETPVVDTSHAIDINYEDHSRLSPGTICKISNYCVFATERDYVIAIFDHAQNYKEKSVARQFFGDGLVAFSEMAENSSKPNIVILTERKFCDGDSIPTLYARYEGPVDTIVGRLRCFREVQSRR